MTQTVGVDWTGGTASAKGGAFSWLRRNPVHQTTLTITNPLKVETLEVNAPSLVFAKSEQMAQDALDELDRYLTFQPGWDGYDGLTFSRDTIKLARNIVMLALRVLELAKRGVTEITPGPASDGSVILEFTVDDRFLILTLDREDTTEIGVFCKHGVTEWEGRMGSSTLAKWLSWLAGESPPPAQMGEDPIHP